MATSRPLKEGACYHWEKNGTCIKGDDCKFAHRPLHQFALSKPSYDRPSSHRHQNQGDTYYTGQVRFQERDHNVGGSHHRNRDQVRSYHNQDGSHHLHQDQVPSKHKFDDYHNKHENYDDRYRSPNPNYKHSRDSHERDRNIVGSHLRNQDQVESHHMHHDQVPRKHKYESYKNDDDQCRSPYAYSDCTPANSPENKNDAYNPKRVKYDERDTPRLRSSVIPKDTHYFTKRTSSPRSVSGEQFGSPNHFNEKLRNNDSLTSPRSLNDGARVKVEENKDEDTFDASNDDLLYDYPSPDQKHLEDVEDGELKEDRHLEDVEMENDAENDKEDKVEEDDNKPATNGDPQSKCDSNDGDVDCDSCKDLKVRLKKASVENAMVRNRLEDLQNLYLELEKAEHYFQHTLSSVRKYLS